SVTNATVARPYLFEHPQRPKQFHEGIVVFIRHPLLEWDYGVVCDRDVFWTNRRTAFGDVTITNALFVFEITPSVLNIKRMHFKRGDIHEVARTEELLVKMMLPQDVTYVLAEKAFDALPEFLYSVDVALHHTPRAIRCVRRTRLELPNLFFYAIVY